LIYNVAVLIGPDGRLIGKYRKVALPRTEIEAGVAPGQEYPVIKTGSSLFFRLDMAISRLLSEQSLTKLLTNANTLSQNAAAVVDEDNRAALKQTLKDLSDIARTVAGRNEQVDKGLVSASQAAENGAKISEAMIKQRHALLERVNKSAAALQTMTEELAHTGRSVRSTVQENRPDIEQFTRQTLSETGALVTELRALTGTLQRVARQLEQEPSSLVLGTKTPQRGPGE
jgi:phospholipid/cholesterol/gamma-HCH transport system substrate-binding protein